MYFESGSTLAEGRYELSDRVGSGGMATVWQGIDTVLDRPVAVKIPGEQFASDPVFGQRFEREARVAAGVSHANLVSVYDFGFEGGRPYLVMELVEGDSLAERLDGGGEVDPRAVAVAVLSALEHIHAAGVVHRDVKPGNVLLASPGRIKLTDFGIALSDGATNLTGTGQVIGTLRYIAPEIMEGGRATARSDLYSAGVVIKDCLEGRENEDLRRLADSLSAEDPYERPGSATNALAAIGAARLGRLGLPSLNQPTREMDRPAPVTPAAAEPAAAPAREPEPIAPPVPAPLLQDTPEPEHQPPAPTPTPAPVPAPARPRSSGFRLSPRVLVGGLVALVAVAAVIAVIAAGGGDPSGTQVAGGGGGQEQANKSGGGSGSDTTTTADSTSASSALPAPAATSNPTLGVQLNDEGYAQLQSGDYAGAVETLRKAVEAFGTETGDITYAYALFNYGQALRLSGDPEAAIPVLEERLQIPDQTETVQAELDAARADAGQD